MYCFGDFLINTLIRANKPRVANQKIPIPLCKISQWYLNQKYTSMRQIVAACVESYFSAIIKDTKMMEFKDNG